MSAEPLSAIIMRLLAKNAEERYQTAAGLPAGVCEQLAFKNATATQESTDDGPLAVGQDHRIPDFRVCGNRSPRGSYRGSMELLLRRYELAQTISVTVWKSKDVWGSAI